MGGLALKQFDAKRLDHAEYSVIASKLEIVLNGIISGLGIDGNAVIVRAYRTKPSYGDVDVVVPKELRSYLSDNNMSMVLAHNFQHKLPSIPFISNGPVSSFGLPLETGGVFQADFIYTSNEYFDFAVEYYAWNDLGNLIGRIAHKLGLKFGHDGLSMPLRDGDNLFDTIYLTRDFKTAIEFLGYSHTLYLYGFDTMEDIFRFTVDTPMFNSAIYDLDNRNHTARVRDKKRPTYTAFLAWLKEHPEVDKAFEFPKDKTFWHPHIWSHFPEAKDHYDSAVERLNRIKFIKTKFNGDLIRGIIGLEGKELGGFIRQFKELFERPADFERWIIKTDQVDIDMAIKALFDEFV